MSLVVTGASGRLGRLTVQALLDRGVEPGRIVAAARTPERLDDLARRGVDVRHADYTDPQSLEEALVGAEKVLLISGSDFGARVDQHRNVVGAAREAGVDLIAYTSLVRADTSGMSIAADHAATESSIIESGLPYAFLRNSWYLENYTEQIATAREHGIVLGSAGAGRLSAATRADYAAAAAAVLVGDGPRRQIYELGGDTAFTLPEYAATLSDLVGEEIAYVDQTPAEYAAFLESAGVPGPVAQILADSDRGLSRDELLVETGDLGRLIGRPTTTMAEAITAAIADGPTRA
jgi:NAD(P)H dehydrogenase (quinone)